MTDALTPDELRDLLATALAGAAGGESASWREKIGPVEKRSLLYDIRSNWRVSPLGTASELEAMRKAVDIVRAAHPYVRDEIPVEPVVSGRGKLHARWR
jgi:hypothetical protein